MSNEDIAVYQDPNGLYKVEEIEICGYENGEEIPSSKWWAVVNKLFPERECYECRNLEVANKLCEELNTMTRSYQLDTTLPEPRNSLECHGLAKRINEKQSKLNDYQTALEHELVCERRYNEKWNEVKLHPDKVKEAYELSKVPTEKQITAYCEETYTKEFTQWKIAKANTGLISKQIDLINDYISLEKYILRKELKE
ncbi:hypothetical protein [Methanobrevibacter sp.]|uniref:hypothetical protein n=1 Tax=Methanobrevibacter sp. TaxID=66852 RepID=UPI0038909928